MTKKPKLELTWIGKENRPRLEPRILLEDPEKSYHAPHRVTDHDLFDNRLIFGDNLLALKALEQEFTEKIKCIFIDPPYNTGSAFEHYDDGVEHSIWLSLMRDRLELLRGLLADDGSIWISIDDNECHYLKVMMDEVFGRANFISNVIWQKIFSPKSTAKHLSDMHDHILLFAKNKEKWMRNLLPRTEEHDKSYKNPDNDPRGPWTSGDLSARNFYGAGTYSITTRKGRVILGPPKGMYWRVSKERFAALDKDGRIWWGKGGDNQPRLKRFLSEVMEGVVPQTIWFHQEVGNTQEAKKEVLAVVPEVPDVFQTTKPERLLKRIIDLSTNPGDWVLDSFAGSGTTGATEIAGTEGPKAFLNPEEERVAQITRDVIRKLENQPQKLPSVSYLSTPDVQAEVVREVAAQYRPARLELEGVTIPPDIAAVVAKTAGLVIQQTIDIPRILVVPKGEVRSGFRPFTLALGTLNYQPPSEELWIQYLRTGAMEVVGLGKGGMEEARLEDYIVSGLVDFDDVAYDRHADLLYGLATQTVRHFRTYLSEEDTCKVLRLHQREIAKFIHVQMQRHYFEEAVEYQVVISKGFTELKSSAYAASATEPPLHFQQSPADKSNMAKSLFGGFKRCLFPVQKFQSEAERVLAVILDREAEKWFKPAKGQFQIFYKSGADHLEYQPDFVAETADAIYMLEPKAKNQMADAEVLAKRDAAVKWCRHAGEHAATCGGKPWKYVLIPHDVIAENRTIENLAAHFSANG